MKLYIESNPDAHPAIKILANADPAPAGFEPATDDVTLWDRWGKWCLRNTDASGLPGCPGFRDYKKLRSEIKGRIEAKAGFDPGNPATYTQANWDLLTSAEKEIASRYFCVPPTGVGAAPLRDEVHTTEQQIGLGMQHHIQSIRAREQRGLAAISEVYNRLSIDDAREVEEELNQIPKGTNLATDVNDDTTDKVKVKTMLDSYQHRGIEGTAEDNGIVGLYDYLLSRIGTPFEGNGMSTKAFAVVGMADMSALAQRCIDVLNDGEY